MSEDMWVQASLGGGHHRLFETAEDVDHAVHLATSLRGRLCIESAV
jgi:hypothetical protein